MSSNFLLLLSVIPPIFDFSMFHCSLNLFNLITSNYCCTTHCRGGPEQNSIVISIRTIDSTAERATIASNRVCSQIIYFLTLKNGNN